MSVKRAHALSHFLAGPRAIPRGVAQGIAALCCLFAAELPAQTSQPLRPRTAAERSGGMRTSTLAEVNAFVQALRDRGSKVPLVQEAMGRSLLQRELPLIRVQPDGPADRLRVLLVGTIHGGEVEGKEALQELLREFAEGQHAELVQALDILVLPIFNVDGNEAIDVGVRINQNGPEEGVGARENAAGFDLNRDFVKLETPEAQALVRWWRRFDPHLLMDLHATNGSPLGYHLTYATSLSVHVDPALARYAHEAFLPSVRTEMATRHGWQTFDYGNFETVDGSLRYRTFGHEPRYLTNAFGLRNRLAVLSEAYAYLPFDRRIAVTRAFVLETLRAAARDRVKLMDLCAEADARASAPETWTMGYGGDFAPPVDGEVLEGVIERVQRPGLGTRLVATGASFAKPAQLELRFAPRSEELLPAGWAIQGPSAEVVATLLRQGLRVHRLTDPVTVPGQRFVLSGVSRSPRAFQGRRLVRWQGSFEALPLELPAGSILIPRAQPLARLAAALLDPRSDDALHTWGFFDDAISAERVAPVLRLDALPADVPAALDAPEDAAVPLFTSAAHDAPMPEGARTLRLAVARSGRKERTLAFESEPNYVDRLVVFRREGEEQTFELEAAEPYFQGLGAGLRGADAPRMLVVKVEAEVLPDERLAFARAARRAGFSVEFRGPRAP